MGTVCAEHDCIWQMHLVEKGAEATEILKKLAAKYYPNEQLIDEEIERSGKAVQLFEIEIEHISGKEIQGLNEKVTSTIHWHR